jgi:dihydrodipicolinate synthase/N-acetylneuraminate lyase
MVWKPLRTPVAVPVIVYDIPYRTGVTIDATHCKSWHATRISAP